jgi:hypothetical protein
MKGKKLYLEGAAVSQSRARFLANAWTKLYYSGGGEGRAGRTGMLSSGKKRRYREGENLREPIKKFEKP